MPHFIIEASQSITNLVEPARLTEAVHAVACTIEGYPMPGVRTRLHLCEHARMADGDPAGAFVHVNIRIGTGFSPDAHRAATHAVADRLSELFQPFMETTPLALSVEVTELDVATRVNRSNVREIMARRQGAANAA